MFSAESACSIVLDALSIVSTTFLLTSSTFKPSMYLVQPIDGFQLLYCSIHPIYINQSLP